MAFFGDILVDIRHEIISAISLETNFYYYIYCQRASGCLNVLAAIKCPTTEKLSYTYHRDCKWVAH